MSSIASVLAATVTLALGLGQATNADPELLVERAWEMLASDEPAAAEAEFRQIVADYPFVLPAHHGLGTALLRQGRAGAAAQVWLTVGARLLDSGRGREARPFLQAAVSAAPSISATHYFLGTAMMGDGEFESALTEFEQAVGLGDTQLALRLSLAGALWELGRLRESREQYEVAILEHDRDPIALHQLGTLLLWQGKYFEALEVLGEAAQRAPTPADLLYDLGRALDGSGDLEGALEVSRQVVRLNPDRAQARYQLATLLARSGDREAAKVQMFQYQRLTREARERDYAAGRVGAAVAQAAAMAQRGELAGAVEIYRRLPETVKTLEGLATTLVALGQHAGAAQALEKALALEPERRDLRLSLARARIAAQRQP